MRTYQVEVKVDGVVKWLDLAIPKNIKEEKIKEELEIKIQHKNKWSKIEVIEYYYIGDNL